MRNWHFLIGEKRLNWHFYLRQSPGHRVTRVVVLVVVLLLDVTYRLSSKFPKLVQIIFKPPYVHMEDLWQQDHIMDSVRPFSDTCWVPIMTKIVKKTSFSGSRRPPIENCHYQKLLSTPGNGGTGHILSRPGRT